MAQQRASLVVFEACGRASYWAREMESPGHEAKLIAPQYVRPFVKRPKNDANDAEAIVIAARPPEMRFVAPKSVDQPSRAALLRGRERLVRQRMMALRNRLSHFRHVDDGSNLDRRSINESRLADDLLRHGAIFSIGLAVRMPAKPAFRLG